MTSEKAVSVEQRLNALVAGTPNSYFAVKTADLGRSSTSIADDPDLTLTVPTPGNYWVACLVSYRGGTGTAEGDMAFGWTVTTGQFVIAAGKRRTADGTYDFQRMTTGDIAQAQTIGLSAHLPMSAQGQWTATSGPTGIITFRWCKNTAADGSTNTTVETYSFLAALQMA